MNYQKIIIITFFCILYLIQCSQIVNQQHNLIHPNNHRYVPHLNKVDSSQNPHLASAIDFARDYFQKQFQEDLGEFIKSELEMNSGILFKLWFGNKNQKIAISVLSRPWEHFQQIQNVQFFNKNAVQDIKILENPIQNSVDNPIENQEPAKNENNPKSEKHKKTDEKWYQRYLH